MAKTAPETSGWAYRHGRYSPTTPQHYWTSNAKYHISLCRVALYRGHALNAYPDATRCPECEAKLKELV